MPNKLHRGTALRAYGGNRLVSVGHEQTLVRQRMSTLIYFNSVVSVQQEKASTGRGRTETVMEGPVQEWNVHAFPNGRVPGIAEPYRIRLTPGSRRHYPQRKMAVG